MSRENFQVGLGLALIALFVLGLSFLYPQYGQLCDQGGNATSEVCPTHDGVSYAFFKIFNFLQLYNGAITAIATGCIAALTFALIRLQRLTAHALMSSERPHMVVNQLKVSGLTSAPTADDKVALQLTYRIQNYGRSPAFAKELAIVIRAAVEELPDGLPYEKVHELRGTTAPDHWYGSQYPSTVLLNADLARFVVAGNVKLFIYGYFKYADVFDRSHETRFAYQLVVDVGADASKHFATVGPGSYWAHT